MRRRRACASGSRSGDGTRRLGVCRAGEWAHGGGDLGSRDLSPTQGERVLQCARTCDRATASRPCARTRVFSTQSRLCTVRRCTELNARGNARSGFLSSCFINRCRPRPHPPSRHWLPPLRVARSRGGGLASTSPSDVVAVRVVTRLAALLQPHTLSTADLSVPSSPTSVSPIIAFAALPHVRSALAWHVACGSSHQHATTLPLRRLHPPPSPSPLLPSTSCNLHNARSLRPTLRLILTSRLLGLLHPFVLLAAGHPRAGSHRTARRGDHPALPSPSFPTPVIFDIITFIPGGRCVTHGLPFSPLHHRIIACDVATSPSPVLSATCHLSALSVIIDTV